MARHGFVDEGEPGCLPQSFADGAGIEVEDAVAKASAGPGTAVMGLVRVKYEDLAGKADRRCPAVAEGLHPLGREADGIGIVAMRIEAMAGEEGLDPLQSPAGGRDPYPVAGGRDAGSF